jgi:hypothetical protein
MTKYIFVSILVLSTSCQIAVKQKGWDNVIPDKIETENDINFQPGFDKVHEYCTGKIDHDIETEQRLDPEFEISEEDRKYEIDDCYYNFDFGSLETLSES